MNNPGAWLDHKAKSGKDQLPTGIPVPNKSPSTGHCSMKNMVLESYKEVLQALCTWLLIPENVFGDQWGNLKVLKELFSERVPVAIAPMNSFDPKTHALVRIRGVDFTDSLKQDFVMVSNGGRKPARSRNSISRPRIRFGTSDLAALLQVRTLLLQSILCTTPVYRSF